MKALRVVIMVGLMMAVWQLVNTPAASALEPVKVAILVSGPN